MQTSSMSTMLGHLIVSRRDTTIRVTDAFLVCLPLLSLARRFVVVDGVLIEADSRPEPEPRASSSSIHTSLRGFRPAAQQSPTPTIPQRPSLYHRRRFHIAIVRSLDVLLLLLRRTTIARAGVLGLTLRPLCAVHQGVRRLVACIATGCQLPLDDLLHSATIIFGLLKALRRSE